MPEISSPPNADRNTRKRYVLLVRHGSRERRWNLPEAKQSMTGWDEAFFSDVASPPNDGRLSPPASPASGSESNPTCESHCKVETKKVPFIATRDLAGQLCDQLLIDRITIDRIFHSGHSIAEQTGRLFARVFELRDLPVEIEPLAALTPEGATSGEEAEAQVKSVIGRIGSEGPNYLIIGHQPQLTKIARRLLPKLPAKVLPLGSSEIACIELGETSQLLWLMTEKSPALLAELKAKIASKFDVAKFFLGALVVGTGLTLSDSVWNLTNRNAKLVAGVGAFAALVSLGLTAATLFSYDRLLMPQDFWVGTDKTDDKPKVKTAWSVSRPPSQAHVILFYEMVHIWTHLFMPAIISAFAAVGLIVAARAHNSLTVPAFAYTPSCIAAHPLLTFLGVVAVAFIISIVVYYLWKPRLGFDD